MTTEPSRRRILRFASAWLMLPLASAAGSAPLADDPLDLRRSRGERVPPRDPGYGPPGGPLRPAPQDVRPPKPDPTDLTRREPGWRPPGPVRRPKMPPKLPKPGVTPPLAS